MKIKFQLFNKIIFLSLILSLVIFDGHSATKISLDGLWKFTKDSMNQGFNQNWTNGLPSELIREVIVPHTWNVDAGSEDYNGQACPITISKVERTVSGAAKIELQIKNDIPSYQINGYILKYTNIKGVDEILKLPILNPGDVFTTEISDINPQFKFRIEKPGGYTTIEY